MKVSGPSPSQCYIFLQVKEFYPFLVCWITSHPFNKIVINNSLSPVSDDSYMHEFGPFTEA